MLRVILRQNRSLWSPGLTAKENLFVDSLMKAVRPVITPNGIPYLQITSEGSHSMSGKKERNDGDDQVVN